MIVASILLTVTFAGCGVSQKLPPDMPKDFGFILRYGVDGKNILNTFEQTYTKDLIMKGTITVKLSFTAPEMKMLYDTMMSIGIMSFPPSIQSRGMEFHTTMNADSSYTVTGSFMTVTPHSFDALEVRMNGAHHSIMSDQFDCLDAEDPVRCRDFDFLIRLIQEILKRKKEYRDLPKPEGGYL
jgi:hypothetical protein